MTADPQRLVRAAAGLAVVAAEIRAAHAEASGDLAGREGWSGVAQRAAGARRGELAGVEQSLAGRLDELVAAVARAARLAAEVEAAVGEAAFAAVSRGEDAFREAVSREAATREADQERAEARRRLGLVGRDLAAAIDHLDPVGLLPEPLQRAVAVGTAGAAAVGAGRRGVRWARWLERVLDPTERGGAAEAAARSRFLAIRTPRIPVLERLGTGIGRTFLPFAVVGGVADAVTAGGREGLAGGVTRVLGGAAAVAAVVLLVGAGPELGVVAGGVLVAHAMWSAGSALWDSRETFSTWLERAGGAVRDGADRLVRWTAPVLAGARDLVAGIGGLAADALGLSGG